MIGFQVIILKILDSVTIVFFLKDLLIRGWVGSEGGAEGERENLQQTMRDAGLDLKTLRS